MEVYKYLEQFPSAARNRLEEVYTEHTAMLQADRFGYLVSKSKYGFI